MPPVPDPDKLALFLDFDGTLVDIAATPADVVVPPALVEILIALDRVLDGALALVSGREIGDLDRHLHPSRMRVAGIHGAEARFSTCGPVERSDAAAIPSDVLPALRHVIETFPGVSVEDKRHAYAVHYRAVPAVRPRLESAMRRFVGGRPGLVLMPGHAIYEIKTPAHSKGTAIEAFMNRKPFAGRTPVFVGDDVTDQFGFETVHVHDGKAYSVGRAMRGVDGWFETPVDVRRWLDSIVAKARVEP